MEIQVYVFAEAYSWLVAPFGKTQGWLRKRISLIETGSAGITL